MKQYLNTEGVKAYPDTLKGLPFCCWRYETQNGRRTKVPYNAKTGRRAKTDTPKTFCSMDEALSVVKNYRIDLSARSTELVLVPIASAICFTVMNGESTAASRIVKCYRLPRNDS